MIDFVKAFMDWVGMFFIVYLVGYSTFLFLSVAVGSSELYASRRRYNLKNEIDTDIELPVSIIAPAYNEEVTVVATVRSLLMLDYKLYEIIVVDDGSTDNTAQHMIEAFGMHKLQRPIHRQIRCKSERAIYVSRVNNIPITLVVKNNGGKADALNMGINVAAYPYFVCIDADTILQHDSLKRIIEPVLEDNSVVAVGGAVRPSNGCQIENGRVTRYSLPKNILACMQVLEYDRSFLAARMLFDRYNGNLIISGAYGLFKKSVVIAAGGYETATLGEDMELVVKLHEYCREHQMPYRIRYAYNAICWSQVPESLADLCKQRRRWHIGLFQSMVRHRRILANPKYGAVSFISYTYFLFYELLSPFIEVFGVLTMVLAYCTDLLNLPFMLMFLLIYAAYSSVLSLTAFFARVQTIDLKLTFWEVMKAIALCFFEVSVLRLVFAWVRTTSLFGYNKKKTSWGKIKRKRINIK